MKYELSGISSPFFGLSWEKKLSEKEMFAHLLLYLESKRILVNPIEMEKKEWCIESVLEIKSSLISITNGFPLNNADSLQIIRNLIDACNEYLDTVSQLNLPNIIFKDSDKWEDINFDKAMKTFRSLFKTEINKIENNYKLTFNKKIPDKF